MEVHKKWTLRCKVVAAPTGGDGSGIIAMSLADRSKGTKYARERKYKYKEINDSTAFRCTT